MVIIAVISHECVSSIFPVHIVVVVVGLCSAVYILGTVCPVVNELSIHVCGAGGVAVLWREC